MSTRIVDDFAVARFLAADLRAVIDHHSFYNDQCMFFELGGDNNVFTMQGASRREVRCRSWSLLGIGQDYRVMQNVVEFSAAAEGGSLRFNGDQHTLPESYIKRARNTVANALTATQLRNGGLSCTFEIQVDHNKTDEFDLKRVQDLENLMPADDRNGVMTWTLFPLDDVKHAALMFAFSHLDSRPSYNKAKVRGHEYTSTPFMKRAAGQQMAFAGL